jgi:hypothetical protein
MLVTQNPLIAGFVEKKHDTKIWTWSGKTTGAKRALRFDCHKAATKMFDEGAL